MKFKAIIILALIAFTYGTSNAESIFQKGEEIEYEVSFLGIGLGSIKIITEDQENLGDKLVQKAKALIKSYDGIPYVSLSTVYQSWMDPSATYSYKFVGNSKFLSPYWLYQEINFDYKLGRIYNDQWENKQKILSDTLYSNNKWSDGLSLFFLARQYTNLKKNFRIPTFMGKDTAFTQLNFLAKRENVSIDAVNYPIRALYFNGTANWEGVYGLSGKFEGWFSDDDARVPLKARMKVIIGSVNIELIKWKRQGWVPPKA